MTEFNQRRRRLINMSGLAVLSNIVPLKAVLAKSAPQVTAQQLPGERQAHVSDYSYVSPLAREFSEYITGTIDRPLPDDVVACAKLHILDTIAAMVSGSRLLPGKQAVRYVETLGGKAQATIIGTRTLTSVLNAAFANAMAGHADESDDTQPIGPFHAGCGCVPAALALSEVNSRTGTEVMRAVNLGYDVGTRLILSLGGTKHNPSCMTNTFAVTATATALLRMSPQEVRYAFAYAGDQASGIGYWDRDLQHIEKAFDFGGMGARNGIEAASMVQLGSTGVEDPFSGTPNIFTVLGENPRPQRLLEDLGKRFYILTTTIKQWGAGMPLQSVLANTMALIKNPAIRSGNIKQIILEVPTRDVHIEDNNPNPDLCAQHLIALTIVDRGVSFWTINDKARMHDPKVLALRKLVTLVPSKALQQARPAHQTILKIETNDGSWHSHRIYKIRGTAQDPMDWRDVEAKARDLMGPVLGADRTHKLIKVMHGFEHVKSVATLRQYLQA